MTEGRADPEPFQNSSCSFQPSHCCWGARGSPGAGQKWGHWGISGDVALLSPLGDQAWVLCRSQGSEALPGPLPHPTPINANRVRAPLPVTNCLPSWRVTAAAPTLDGKRHQKSFLNKSDFIVKLGH